MKPLTTSVYTFEKLHDGGFLYVDKTAGIYGLIEQKEKGRVLVFHIYLLTMLHICRTYMDHDQEMLTTT